MAENPKALIIILIDEVESITFSRSALSSAEPSDSMRVVNAVLTQIDQLQRYPNVLILTTSNLSQSIDSAFVDRADLKQFIDYPSSVATFHIFKSAIMELMKVSVVKHFLKFMTNSMSFFCSRIQQFLMKPRTYIIHGKKYYRFKIGKNRA